MCHLQARSHPMQKKVKAMWMGKSCSSCPGYKDVSFPIRSSKRRGGNQDRPSSSSLFPRRLRVGVVTQDVDPYLDGAVVGVLRGANGVGSGGQVCIVCPGGPNKTPPWTRKLTAGCLSPCDPRMSWGGNGSKLLWSRVTLGMSNKVTN